MSISIVVDPARVGCPVAWTNAEYGVSDARVLGDMEHVGVHVSFAHGRVVSEREANGYDDSDFYATYRKDDGGFREVQTGTTRFSSVGYGSHIDATPDIRDEYQAFLTRRSRADRACALLRRRNNLREERAAARITIREQKKLRGAFNFYGEGGEFDRIIRLLRTKKFRSTFRESLSKQVRDWLAGDNGFRTPLTPKQMWYLS